jgi:hypothetical protein
MPRNGSGVFSPPAASYPAVSGTLIESAKRNAVDADIATAITNSIAVNGESVVTNNIPFGGNKLTGVGAATASTDAMTLFNAQNGTGVYVATVGGTADVITISPSPVIASYVAGQMFSFIASGANTTNVTVNVNGLGAKAVTKNGTTALVADDIPSGFLVTIRYDGTRFQLVGKVTSGANSDITSLTGVTAINRTGGTSITGTNTNNNASAGQIGEYIESSILIGSAISLTTNVVANVTSISLTAGDWDVAGIVRVHSNSATTSFTQAIAAISLTSATLDPEKQANIFTPAAVPTAGINYCALGIPATRVSLASTTTVYLVVRSAFTVSTAQAYGNITARRIR